MLNCVHDHCTEIEKIITWSLISVNDWLSVFSTPKKLFVTVNSRTSRDWSDKLISGGKFSGTTKPSVSSKLNRIKICKSFEKVLF